MPILDYIDQSLVGFTPGQPEFLDLVTDTLGNAGDPSDGFDTDLEALILSVSATDDLMNVMDSNEQDLFDSSAVYEAIETDSLVNDFGASVPVLDAFNSQMTLKTVDALNLPAAPVPPAGGPPLQVCVQQPPSPPAPPAPPPVVVQPQPCPAGTFLSNDGTCQPIATPPPPAPPPVTVPPVVVQTNPCPADSFLSNDGTCQPNQTTPAPPPAAPAPTPPPDCPPGYMLIQYAGSAPVCRQISGPGPTAPPQFPPITDCPPGTYPDYSFLQCVQCDPLMFQIDISMTIPGSGVCTGQMPVGGADCSPLLPSGCAPPPGGVMFSNPYLQGVP